MSGMPQTPSTPSKARPRSPGGQVVARILSRRRRLRRWLAIRPAARSRPLMSAHSSHTDAGITPVRISSANTWHPRHTAKIDSSPAATTNSPSTASAAVSRRGSTRARAPRSPSRRPSPGRTASAGRAPASWRRAAARSGSARSQPSGLSVGPVRHPRPEAVCERNQQPVGPRRQDHHRTAPAPRRQRHAPPSHLPDSERRTVRSRFPV